MDGNETHGEREPFPGAAAQDSREVSIRAAFQQVHDALDALERTILLVSPQRVSQPSATLPLVQRDVMKPREYAEYMRVNVRTVHAWITRGMPHFLVESRIRIRVAEADAWLEAAQASKPEQRPAGSKPKAGKSAKPKHDKPRRPKARSPRK